MKKILLSAVLFGTMGCFATQEDIRVLQGDLVLMRNESFKADSARRAQLDRVIATLRTMNDSLYSISGRVTRLTADTRNGMAEIGQQLVTIQELTGQSQRRLQEVRASLESRTSEFGAVTPGASAAPGGTPAAGSGPGPNQLFQLALEQLQRGSNSAARAAFQDLLNKYPTSDVADDAEFYIAQAYAVEGNQQAADSVYAGVAKKYPKSPRAANALFKLASSASDAGDAAQARKLYNEIVKKYPRSDEATLARDRLKALGQ